ncbi:MAG: NAD-binding protein [Methylobacter sp.]
MLTRLIVHFAYFLKRSKHYRRTKKFFYNLLENPNSRLKSYFDIFMIGLVMISVCLLIYEVDNKFGEGEILFEHCIVSLFIIEYVLRGWLCSDTHTVILEHYERAEYLNVRFKLSRAIGRIAFDKIKYVFSPMALIDLLAILPSYRPLRFLRVFLIFRLFKLFRYFNSIKLFANVLASRRFELVTLGMFLAFLVFTGSTGIYLFENPNNGGEVENLFDAFYWAVVTVATVGYGDIAPHTISGRIVAMALILVGLGILSFLVSIIVAAFNEEMDKLRESSIYADLERFDSFIIICGFGRVGQHIASQLAKDRQHFVVIDPRESNVQKAKRLGYLVIHEDASKNDVIRNAGINNGASAVICTTGDDVINVYITLTSRHLNPNIRIISRANSSENVKKLYQAGANNVIQPFEIAGMVVAEYIGQPVAFEAILGIVREECHIIMETLTVHPGSFLVGTSIAAVDFEQRKLMLLGIISTNPTHQKHKNSYALTNQHFYFNPEPHFVLREGDLLVVMGREYAIDYFREKIERSCIRNRRKR